MQKIIIATTIAALLLLAAACGSNSGGSSNGKVIKSAPAGNLNATLTSATGQLKHGGDEFTVSFTDASGKPVDVGAVALTFHMPGMGTMPVMNDQTIFTTTNTPGVYRGRANIEMAGEWQAQLTYEGPAGSGRTTFSVNVQ